MKKHYEKTEDYLQEVIKEDEDYTKFLMNTYPELKQLEDIKIQSSGLEEGSKLSGNDANLLTVSNSTPN